MGDAVRITVIATGFDRSIPALHRMTSATASRPVEKRPTPPARPTREQERVSVGRAEAPRPQAPDAQRQSSSFRIDDLDIPAFLRKRR
jgi:cell division protein FtsZ